MGHLGVIESRFCQLLTDEAAFCVLAAGERKADAKRFLGYRVALWIQSRGKT
jgi:hypothetical protein